MADALYRKLLSKDLLRRAWHWSLDDSRSDFMADPLTYYDFQFHLDDHLEVLLRQLRYETYHARPLHRIDVPKATLAVRPGSVPEIQDRIVGFAVVYLIAPAIDRQLTDSVYSLRFKKTSKWPRSLPFEDREIIRFPLLKGKTIRRLVVLIEPWYTAWPIFRDEVRYAYETQGFTYLVVSDIAAYFENVNHTILKDVLTQHLPREQRLINMLMEIVRCWTWPTTHGGVVDRGLPQGNSISRFLGNAYLLPLDAAFRRFCDDGRARYFRYMDDVKILCKSKKVAREAVLRMNEVLQYLHLNMQDAKTHIRSDEDIRTELYDDRVDRVTAVIDRLRQTEAEPLSVDTRRSLQSEVRDQLRDIPRPGRQLGARDSRLYRRAVTAFLGLEDPQLVNDALQRIRDNSDDRLIKRCLKYACMFPRRSPRVAEALLHMLTASEGLFELEEALILTAGRYLYRISPDLVQYARRVLRQKTKHWYVRAEAALLVEQTLLPRRSLGVLRQLFEHEPSVPIRRALIRCLCQYEDTDQAHFVQRLLRDLDEGISRAGRMLLSLRDDPSRARAEIKFLFRDLKESQRLLDSFYRIEVLKHSRDRTVRRMLMQELRGARDLARPLLLRRKLKRVLQCLHTSLSR